MMWVFIGMCVLMGLVLVFMIALYVFWFLIVDDESDDNRSYRYTGQTVQEFLTDCAEKTFVEFDLEESDDK